MPTDSSHEKIARRAYEMWQSAGCPDGTHDEHWFDAERELAPTHTTHVEKERGHPDHAPATPAADHHAAEQQALQAELKKHAARAPQIPTTHAPKSKPAPPGKPVWDKPHSS